MSVFSRTFAMFEEKFVTLPKITPVMSTAGLINRYVWFVTTIYNRGPISLEDIQRRFESHFGLGEELSERQFHRYTDAVEELFDIEIKYSRTQRG